MGRLPEQQQPVKERAGGAGGCWDRGAVSLHSQFRDLQAQCWMLFGGEKGSARGACPGEFLSEES